MKDQRIYCHDIIERIERIERYTHEGQNAFLQSSLLQDAVIRNFEVIGEIVKRLDSTLIAKYSQVTWTDFAGFRDVLIHQYHKIRLDLVWEFIQEDLPPLKTAIMALLNDLDNQSEQES